MDPAVNPDRSIVFALLDASARIERRLDRALSAIKGISFSEFQLLDALLRSPDAAATRVDLAEMVGLTPSGVTRALKPLERLGFVETVKDDRDARRSLATLTGQGHELLADASGVIDDTISSLDLLHNLTAERRAPFAAVLGMTS